MYWLFGIWNSLGTAVYPIQYRYRTENYMLQYRNYKCGLCNTCTQYWLPMPVAKEWAHSICAWLNVSNWAAVWPPSLWPIRSIQTWGIFDAPTLSFIHEVQPISFKGKPDDISVITRLWGCEVVLRFSQQVVAQRLWKSTHCTYCGHWIKSWSRLKKYFATTLQILAQILSLEIMLLSDFCKFQCLWSFLVERQPASQESQ